MLQHKVEHRAKVYLGAFRCSGHPAVAPRAVEHREVELLVGCVEVGEEIEDLVQDIEVALVRPVDLVDHDDGTDAALQCLRHHELRLRQGPFRGVDENDGAVDHIEDPLDLTAEVGVAGRIDDVDARVLPQDARALGEDGDAPLALEIVGIHGALAHPLVLAERAGLLQELVDQRGLAVVDVGNDCDVSELHQGLCALQQLAPT